jgi:Fibronectin type III domain
MTNHLRAPGIALLGALTLAVGIAAVARSSSDPPAQAAPKATAAKAMRLEDTTVIVETNATDGDAGLQFFLDGEPWRSMKIFRPGGKKILDVNATGRLKNFGLTELFSETNEPEFKELPFSKFKRRFPEGTYKFVGRSIEGRKQVGRARLSHRIPDGPEIIAPAAGSIVPDGNVEARWAPAPQPGIDIEGYRVIVEREDPFRLYQVELPASQTSVTIPSEFLEPGTEYLLEIQTIERNGNQTISEHFFNVG